MDQKSTCEYCNGNGLVPVFHRDYRGDPTIWVDRTDSDGNPFKRRLPGVINAHCLCDKGRWMRERTDEEIRKRIPQLRVILEGKTEYQLLDPTEVEQPEVSESAREFIAAWRSGFGGKLLKEAPKPSPKRNPDDVANEIRHQIRERSKRLNDPPF